MSAELRWNRVVAELSENINGFIGASIVDLDTGMALASQVNQTGFDLEMASAYNSEMVKAKLKTIQALNINTDLEDMLLTLGDQLHLIRMLSPNSFLYLAARRAETNLAILRSAVNRYTAPAR